MNASENGKTGVRSEMYGNEGVHPATTNARKVTSAVSPGDFPSSAGGGDSSPPASRRAESR